MTTAERLQNFYDFDGDLLDRLEQVASDQNTRTFDELADQYDLANSIRRSTHTQSGKLLEYLQLTPPGDYDERHTRVLYTPMATPIDQSVAMRSIRLFAADPTAKLTVFGNPAALGRKGNSLPLYQIETVFRGNLLPVIRNSAAELAGERHATVDVLGYSAGADEGAEAAKEMRVYGLRCMRGVWTEPVSSAQPGIMSLGKRFFKSGEALDGYVAAADSEPLLEARRRADTGMPRYIGGLLRPSNIAIAKALSRSHFAVRAKDALAVQPQLRALIAWGSASEITDNQCMSETVRDLERDFGPERVGHMVLRGMHHAGGDDIDLHAAIMLQGLRG